MSAAGTVQTERIRENPGMPKEYFFPDEKEPHLHVHKGGVTYTDTRHKHKDLKSGSSVLRNNCTAVVTDLQAGNAREQRIAQWIQAELL